LTDASSGRIYIEDKEISHWNPIELRRQIGYVIQQVGLFPHLTVSENIAYVLRITGAEKRRQRERATELISLIGMDESYLTRYPSELSGGQAQRVGFARALAGDPSIILMDEPFGALDQITRLQLQDELLKLQQQLKKTVVFVTHDIQEAMKMGDKVALMRDGQLVQAGKPADFFTCPKEPFVTEFIGGSDFFKLLGIIMVKEVMAPPGSPEAKKSRPYLFPQMSLADALRIMFAHDMTEMDVRDKEGTAVGLVRLEWIRHAMSSAGSSCEENESVRPHEQT
jgi:osmoprotectant transport system ATP-binding protein